MHSRSIAHASPAFQSVFDDWSPPVGLTLATRTHCCSTCAAGSPSAKRGPTQFTTDGDCLSFLVGLGRIWIAIASPLDGFADALLSAHMVEHLLLMSVVPPLLLLGFPVVPLLRGLPALRHARHRWAAASLQAPPPPRALARLPASRMARYESSIFLLWHVPAAYDFALEHEDWHDFEHICFLFTSLLFWWCVLRPWPAARRTRDWDILLYLIGADLVNTALSAFLAFCNRAGLSVLRHPLQPLSDPPSPGPGPRRSHHVGLRLGRLPHSSRRNRVFPPSADPQPHDRPRRTNQIKAASGL